MSDLTTFEQRLVDHLSAEAPLRAPEHLVDGILATTRSTRQHRRWAERATGLRSTRDRGRLMALAAGLAVITIGAAAVMSGAIPRRPDSSPSPSAPPAPSPAASLAPPSGYLPFTSRLYGYSIEYPAAWTASAATTTWSDEDLWPEPWWLTSREIADVFDGPGAWRLAVVAVEASAGTDASRFVRSGALDRPQFYSDGECRIRSNMWAGSHTGLRDRWESATIGGLAGLVRWACGIYDGVVVVGSRAYIFSLETAALFGYKPGGPSFDELMATVAFDAPPDP